MSDNSIRFNRMELFNPSEANRRPAIRIKRIANLLKNESPNICIVRGEGIGDVIMTTPVVHQLKIEFPKSKITYATNTLYLNGALPAVLKYNKDVDKVIDRTHVSEENFDIVASLHCPAIFYEKKENPVLNRIDIFASHLGLKLVDPVPRYVPQLDEIDKVAKFVDFAGFNKTILVQLSSSSDKRNCPPQTMFKILEKLSKNYCLIILKHKTDYEMRADWRMLKNTIIIEDLDVRSIAALMLHVDLVLCPDSSILHLAGALGVSTVALFGPTPPESRINYYKNAVGISYANYNFCPCWWGRCPIGMLCWKELDVNNVVQVCIDKINSSERIKFSDITTRLGD